MKKTQWFVLVGLFLFGAYLFGNYYAGGWGMGTTGIGYTQNYEVLGNFSFFLAIVCLIMGLLEPKQKR
jgi:hypothetical protein